MRSDLTVTDDSQQHPLSPYTLLTDEVQLISKRIEILEQRLSTLGRFLQQVGRRTDNPMRGAQHAPLCGRRAIAARARTKIGSGNRRVVFRT
jgi:hypothetical protein